MRKYIILRDKNRNFVRSKDLDPTPSSENLPEPVLEVQDLDNRQFMEVNAEPDVVGITPTMPIKLIKPVAISDVKHEGNAWGIAAVGADNSPYSGRDVVVCVLDSGIDSAHTAFQNMTLTFKDFSGDGIEDDCGHGTHCAGTIFGRAVNGTRIGVAPGISKALIGKVLRNDGSGASDMVFRGIQWALEQGADVVSMSLGFDFPGFVKVCVDDGWPVDLATSHALTAYSANLRMFDALMMMARARAAFDEGAIFVAASGNESRRDLHEDYRIAVSVPGTAEGVISVGAAGKEQDCFSIASFSNSLPTVCAPGIDIISAKLGGGLVKQSGTSMACPHVAGVAALWWEALRNAAPDGKTKATHVTARLLSSVRMNVFAPGTDVTDRGVGLVLAPNMSI